MHNELGESTLSSQRLGIPKAMMPHSQNEAETTARHRKILRRNHLGYRREVAVEPLFRTRSVLLVSLLLALSRAAAVSFRILLALGPARRIHLRLVGLGDTGVPRTWASPTVTQA